MVNIEGVVDWHTLEQNVRETTLLEQRNGETVYPYENATIQLKNINYRDVSPTSLYVLRKNLAIQAQIAVALFEEGYDPLELDGGLLISGIDDSVQRLVPPIVEETALDGQYVLDGAHRAYRGYLDKDRDSFVAIHVSGIHPDTPAYASPNRWDEIKELDNVPQDPAEKKHYRDGYRGLYRNFGPLNGSAIREKPAQSNESF